MDESKLSVKDWIKYHTGKHLCQCGCCEVIQIYEYHHAPSCGIPKFISGHNMKTSDARKKAGEKCLKQLESGNLKPFTGQEMKGKHHSDITKELMRESALNWIDENPTLKI